MLKRGKMSEISVQGSISISSGTSAFEVRVDLQPSAGRAQQLNDVTDQMEATGMAPFVFSKTVYDTYLNVLGGGSDTIK